nr:retrovirus-related Pol polyprotein from transposon TNT 1-94 [Tanacetum cinerariifolium]
MVVTVDEENGTTRTKKYEELLVTKKLQADCDLKATNIVLQGLPPDVYAIVNHHKVTKEIWDRVKLLMQGTKLSLQEKECKLYDEFDKFSFVKGETLYQYYWRFAQLINKIKVINMSMRPVQGNATSFEGNNARGHARVVRCYNYQGKGHMARQCTQPKRPRNAALFKKKAMLAEAQESNQILDQEKLAFLADLGIPGTQAAQTTIPNTATFQTEDLNAYDFNYHDVSNAKSVISSQHVVIPVIDDEKTLILGEVSRSKMLAKQNDPISKEKKVNTTPVNYVELNRLSKDFGKCFVPQHELFVKQAYWLQTSHLNTDQSDISLVKIKAPKELLKITHDAITEGEWGFEHTKAIFLNEIVPFLKTLKDVFNIFDKDLLNEEEKVKQEMDEIETINIDLKHSVAKLLYKNKRLHKEIEHLKNIYKDQFDSIKKTCALSKEHFDSLIAQLNSNSMENADLKGQIQEKVFVTTSLQNELRKLNGKNVLDNATTISLGRSKLDLDPLVPRVYSVEGHGHNLFFVEQFHDLDLEVAFWKNTRFIQNLNNVYLLSGSEDTNLYTISLEDMLKTSLICLLSKSSKTKSWLWNRQLSHLNFGTLNKLAKDGLVRGIPKLKYKKDHMCSTCALCKSKKSSHQPKAEDTNQ